MSKEWVSNAGTAVLVVCALLVTGLVVRRELAPGTRDVREGGEPVPGWEVYARGGQSMGPAEAPLTLVEFSDFQCPACRVLAGSLKAIREQYPRDVRVVYRHFPLRGHNAAIPAARASECAAAQGRFTQFHDALFAGQDSLAGMAWEGFARQAAVPDLAAFSRCVESPAPVASLHADTLAGRALQVGSTPTLLVNGKRYNGAPPLASLQKIVREELRAARRTARR